VTNSDSRAWRASAGSGNLVKIFFIRDKRSQRARFKARKAIFDGRDADEEAGGAVFLNKDMTTQETPADWVFSQNGEGSSAKAGDLNLFKTWK
jgi:hypothetical protein